MSRRWRPAVVAVIGLTLLWSGLANARVSEPITVYFTLVAPTTFYLVPVAVAHDGAATPAQALDYLIQGPPPGSGLYGPVPANTQVRDISVVDGIAQVDFSEELLAGAQGSAGETLLIGAITNTLCRFPGIDQVQFLVEGQIIGSLGGHIEANEPFSPAWGMVIASPFTDVIGHWAEGNISAFFLTGMVQGYGDDTFRPQRSISRAEFLKLLVLTVDAPLVTPLQPTFGDVTGQHWAFSYVEAAVSAGILVAADYGQRLSPDQPLSRREMAVLLTRANGQQERANQLVQADLPYSDVADEPGWARGYIAAVTELGLMQGDDTGTFRPQGTTTRAEATAVLTRQLGMGEENVRMVWPRQNESVGNWVLVGGVARAFEATVNARTLTATGQEYGSTYTTATAGGPDWGFWAIMLPLPRIDGQVSCTVEAFTLSAEDGERQDLVNRDLVCP